MMTNLMQYLEWDLGAENAHSIKTKKMLTMLTFVNYVVIIYVNYVNIVIMLPTLAH